MIKLGDYVNFPDEGLGLVLATNNDGCIARFRNEAVARYTHADKKLHWLPEIAAREWINKSADNGDQEETETNDNKNMKATTVAELQGFKNKQVIPCFEGVIQKLYEPKSGTSKGRKWSFQSGYIKDDSGDEHRITFAGPENAQDEDEVKGKRVRLTPGLKNGKPVGLSLIISDQEDKDGNPYRNITADSGCKIEWVGGKVRDTESGDAQPETAREPARQGRAEQSASTSADTVETRVKAYFDVMASVISHVRATNPLHLTDDEMASKRLGGFVPAEIKEITTGICMSFKGQYGAYAAPIFGGAQSTEEHPLGEDTTEETQEEKPYDWRAFVHPQRGVPLGDIPIDKHGTKSGLAALILWAYTADPSSDDARAMQAALMAASNDPKIKLAPANLLRKLIEIEGVDQSAAEFVVEAAAGKSLASIPDFDAAKLLPDFKDLIEQIKAHKDEPAREELPE